MKRLTLTVAVLLLTACATPQVPRDHFYRLAVNPPQSTAAPWLAGTVEVARVRADGMVADRPLTWAAADSPHEVQAYHYHQWVAPPPQLLQDALVSYLRGAGVAERVVTPELRVASDYVVVGRLRRLELVTGPAPAVAVDLELGLRGSNPDRVLLLRDYRETRAAADASVGAAVQALSAAVDALFARFVADLPRR